MSGKRVRGRDNASRSEDTVRLHSDVNISRTGRFIARESSYSTRGPGSPPAMARLPKHIERAVYSYIQAKRALGETTVNTADIARALDIPLHIVELAIIHLQPKGIRRSA